MTKIQVSKVTSTHYLEAKVATFKAGCIAGYLNNWTSLTSDEEILGTVTGLPLDFETTPQCTYTHKYQDFNKSEENFVTLEIETLLRKKVIAKSAHEKGEFISPIFLRPKSEGSFRLILNLKKLNSHMPKIHFKMDTIHSVLQLVHKNCFMTKLDIKDAYYSIPIRESDKKFLKFMHEGTLYSFQALPNGLSSGPRKFTKLLKPPLAALREQNINIVAYIDDLIILDTSYEKCLKKTQICAQLFDSLGFVIHPDKSNFTPSNVIEYLGFVIDSNNMVIRLTDKKKLKTKENCCNILEIEKPTIREVARLLGTLTSCLPGVKFGPLHYKALEVCKIEALKRAKGKFDEKLLLSKEAKLDIQWWIGNISRSHNHISYGNTSITITTDASNKGWGAVSGTSSASGHWSLVEMSYHINVLELKAVDFGLRALLQNVFKAHIKVLSDNTTTVACINKMGTTRSKDCNKVAQDIWNWVIAHGNWLTASHIPGRVNTEADKESRKSLTRTEWKLNPSIFKSVMEHFDWKPEIDLFASRINFQIQKFVSYHHDPDSWAVNAFTFDWGSMKFYAFPPFSCVNKMLNKIVTDKAEGIVIVPNWPSQCWYSMLKIISANGPFIISPSNNQLHLPNQPMDVHPLHKTLELLACHVNGNLYTR